MPHAGEGVAGFCRLARHLTSASELLRRDSRGSLVKENECVMFTVRGHMRIPVDFFGNVTRVHHRVALVALGVSPCRRRNAHGTPSRRRCGRRRRNVTICEPYVGIVVRAAVHSRIHVRCPWAPGLAHECITTAPLKASYCIDIRLGTCSVDCGCAKCTTATLQSVTGLDLCACVTDANSML
jgi:hypothetical protein